MIKIFDTHAHYNDIIYDVDRDDLFRKMYSNGVTHVTLIGGNLEESIKEKELAKKYRDVKNVPKFYFTVGDHPDEIPKFGPESNEGVKYLEVLESVCKTDDMIDTLAIGEIGLDYHGDFKTEEDFKNQEKWFKAEINLAKKFKLPIVIHSRDACEDTLNIVKEHMKDMKGIIHCFSYEKEIAIEYVKLGFYIGVGGVVTFKNGRKLKEVVESIPIEKIVTETDAPWLSPTPHRGERNDSSYIKYVIEEIARLKGLNIEKTSEILYSNALDVYNLH